MPTAACCECAFNDDCRGDGSLSCSKGGDVTVDGKTYELDKAITWKEVTL